MEHARTDHVVLPLEIVRHRLLAFKKRAELGRHRKTRPSPFLVVPGSVAEHLTALHDLGLVVTAGHEILRVKLNGCEMALLKLTLN
jgi:hypothetical protein